MPPLSKWIDGLATDGSVGDAARRSLEERLAAVAYWLPLAARQLDDDSEKVHQLRVSTRRAIVALKLYRDWLPRGPADWLRKRLKKVRQAAGAARDLDVFAKWLRDELGDHENNVLSTALRERAEAQPKIVDVARRLAKKNRFGRKLDRLLDSVRPRGPASEAHDSSFQNWASTRLGQVATGFFAALPSDANDLPALHQFRIRGKRLRYTIELLAPAFDPRLRDEQYPIVERLQELLGKINDCVAGGDQLQEWRSEAAAHDQQQLLEGLIDRQRTALEMAIEEYRAWWTVDRADSLRRGLAAATVTQFGTGPHPPDDEPAREEEIDRSNVAPA